MHAARRIKRAKKHGPSSTVSGGGSSDDDSDDGGSDMGDDDGSGSDSSGSEEVRPQRTRDNSYRQHVGLVGDSHVSQSTSAGALATKSFSASSKISQLAL